MRKSLLLVALSFALVATPEASATPRLTEGQVRALVGKYVLANRGPFIVQWCRVGRAHGWCRVSWYGYSLTDERTWWDETISVDTICGKRITWSAFADENPLEAPVRCHQT